MTGAGEDPGAGSDPQFRTCLFFFRSWNPACSNDLAPTESFVRLCHSTCTEESLTFCALDPRPIAAVAAPPEAENRCVCPAVIIISAWLRTALRTGTRCGGDGSGQHTRPAHRSTLTQNRPAAVGSGPATFHFYSALCRVKQFL